MLDPGKRYFGHDTWAVFHDYYMWANILSKDDTSCHRYVRPENHSFEVFLAGVGMTCVVITCT